jgi:hypothetical protein
MKMAPQNERKKQCRAETVHQREKSVFSTSRHEATKKQRKNKVCKQHDKIYKNA